MKRRGNNRIAYIAEMARELAKMARADGDATLSYLLEVAALEARDEYKPMLSQASRKDEHEGERL